MNRGFVKNIFSPRCTRVRARVCIVKADNVYVSDV